MTSLNIYLSEIRLLLIMASSSLFSWFGHGAKYQPMPRAWHTSAQVGSKTLLHGGVTKNYSEKTKQRLSSVLEVFDSNTELWQQKEVTGDTPDPGVYAASAAVNGDLFTFGGYNDEKFYNSLHSLKNASQWLKLCPQNEEAESPMAKAAAGMVAFGNQLLLIGGYGIPHSPAQPGAAFIKDHARGASDGLGWTNELHIFNIKNGMHLSMLVLIIPKNELSIQLSFCVFQTKCVVIIILLQTVSGTIIIYTYFCFLRTGHYYNHYTIYIIETCLHLVDTK